MKRGTPRHPKVTDLATAIKKEVYSAAGLLELLWHFTAEFAPRGDVGRHTDGAIAKAIHWRGNAAALTKALVDSRWLDMCDICRLAVHDWPQHADDATHMKLARAREFFCDGTAPSLKRLPAHEKSDATLFYAESVRTAHTHKALCGEGLGLGNGKGGGGEGAVRPEFDDQWQQFRQLYSEIEKPDLVEEDFTKAHFTWAVLDFEQKTRAIVNLAARKLHHDPQYIPRPDKYLQGSEYRRTVVPRSNGSRVMTIEEKAAL